MMAPSPQFVQSVRANVAYWRRRTGRLDRPALAQLEVDRPNLLRAAEFGLALAETWRETADVILQTFPFVEQGGHWREWIPVLERALASCGPADLALCGRLLDQLGIFYRLDWRLEAAIQTHRQEEQIGLEGGDERRLAYARHNLSEAYRQRGQYEQAEGVGRAALDGFKALGEPVSTVGAALVNLGMIAQARGQMGTAVERLQEAVDLWRRLDQPVALGRSLKNLAIVLEVAGRPGEALPLYQEALAVLAITDSELDKVQVELSLGTLYFRQGQLDKAEAAFWRADSLYLRQSGHTYYQALAANNLGNVFLAQDRLAEAESCLQGSLFLWRQVEAPVMLANTLGALAEVAVAQAQLEVACSRYDEAIALLAGFPEDDWACHLREKFTAARESL